MTSFPVGHSPASLHGRKVRYLRPQAKGTVSFCAPSSRQCGPPGERSLWLNRECPTAVYRVTPSGWEGAQGMPATCRLRRGPRAARGCDPTRSEPHCGHTQAGSGLATAQSLELSESRVTQTHVIPHKHTAPASRGNPLTGGLQEWGPSTSPGQHHW